MQSSSDFIALYTIYSSLLKKILLRALSSKQESNFHITQIEMWQKQHSRKNLYWVTRMFSFALGLMQYNLGKSVHLKSLQEYLYRSEISSEQT